MSSQHVLREGWLSTCGSLTIQHWGKDTSLSPAGSELATDHSPLSTLSPTSDPLSFARGPATTLWKLNKGQVPARHGQQRESEHQPPPFREPHASLRPGPGVRPVCGERNVIVRVKSDLAH